MPKRILCVYAFVRFSLYPLYKGVAAHEKPKINASTLLIKSTKSGKEKLKNSKTQKLNKFVLERGI